MVIQLNFILHAIIFNFFLSFCVCEQNLVLYNITKHHVTWTLDLSNTGKLFKDGTFKFSVLNGIIRPNAQYNVSINFCPSKIFSPIFVVILSIYPSYMTLFYYVYRNLDYLFVSFNLNNYK